MICSSSSITKFTTCCAFGLAGLVGLVALTATPAIAAEPAAVAPTTIAPAPEEAKLLGAAELDAFLGRFAAMTGLSANFREEKHMALLAVPLVNEGVLHFAPPGRLIRHTSTPVASSVLIDGTRLTFGDARGVDAIGFDDNPVVGLFVTSFVKIFAGDRDALAQMYTMELRGDPAGAWTLKLKPRLSPMDKIIEGIELRGEGLVIGTMIVREVGGDQTTTTFTAVDTQRRFSDAELARLFRIAR